MSPTKHLNIETVMQDCNQYMNKRKFIILIQKNEKKRKIEALIPVMEILDPFLLFTMAFKHFQMLFGADKCSHMLTG